jgi:hypothetical protein
MSTTKTTSKSHLQNIADEALLAQLGYKQELRRAFTPLEVGMMPDLFECTTHLTMWFAQVFGVAFGYIGLFPSLA